MSLIARRRMIGVHASIIIMHYINRLDIFFDVVFDTLVDSS